MKRSQEKPCVRKNGSSWWKRTLPAGAAVSTTDSNTARGERSLRTARLARLSSGAVSCAMYPSASSMAEPMPPRPGAFW